MAFGQAAFQLGAFEFGAFQLDLEEASQRAKGWDDADEEPSRKKPNLRPITREELITNGFLRGSFLSEVEGKQDFSGQADFVPDTIVQAVKPNTKALRLLLLLS